MKFSKVAMMTLMVGLMFLCTQVFAETLVIPGTGAGAAVLQEIAKAFVEKYPGNGVEVPKSIGSGGGIKAAGTGECLLARVSRPIKDSEQNFGLTYKAFAKDPIVFMVNKSVNVGNLSPEQLCDIYAGKITNWNQVGGQDQKIRVIRREDGDSSYGVLLKTLPGFNNITITDKAKTAFSDGETLDLCAKTPQTIAFGTYGNAMNANVNVVKINGLSAVDSSYPYFGELAFVYKESGYNGIVKQFVEFAISDPAAHKAITAKGSIAVQ